MFGIYETRERKTPTILIKKGVSRNKEYPMDVVYYYQPKKQEELSNLEQGGGFGSLVTLIILGVAVWFFLPTLKKYRGKL